MGTTFRMNVNDDVLQWALENGEMTPEYAYNKFPKLAEWLKGTVKPTFKQLETFSHYAHLPFDYFMSDKIPEEDYSFVKFRTVKNKNIKPSRKLIDTINDLEVRQGWYQQYLLDENSNYKFKYHDYLEEKDSLKTLSSDIEKLLNISKIRKKALNDYQFFNQLKIKISSLGIMVMQNGIVGNNTHRKLDLNEFRALALDDDIVPVIFINATDSIRGKIFSLVHELIHILFNQSEVLNENWENVDELKQVERRINLITVSVLAPLNLIKKMLQNRTNYNFISKMSTFFHLSNLAMAIRLKDLGFIDQKKVNDVESTHQTNNISHLTKKGGNYYNNIISRVDPNLATAVYNSESNNQISLFEAANVIGTSVKVYQNLMDKLFGLE